MMVLPSNSGNIRCVAVCRHCRESRARAAVPSGSNAQVHTILVLHDHKMPTAEYISFLQLRVSCSGPRRVPPELSSEHVGSQSVSPRIGCGKCLQNPHSSREVYYLSGSTEHTGSQQDEGLGVCRRSGEGYQVRLDHPQWRYVVHGLSKGGYAHMYHRIWSMWYTW